MLRRTAVLQGHVCKAEYEHLLANVDLLPPEMRMRRSGIVALQILAYALGKRCIHGERVSCGSVIFARACLFIMMSYQPDATRPYRHASLKHPGKQLSMRCSHGDASVISRVIWVSTIEDWVSDTHAPMFGIPAMQHLMKSHAQGGD